MITIMDEANIREYPNKVQTVKTYAGLSTDTKPTDGVANGSTFLEMDTSDVYIYDKANSLWRSL